MKIAIIAATTVGLLTAPALAQTPAAFTCQQPLGHHLMEVESECPDGSGTVTSLQSMAHSTYGRHLDWEPISYMDFPIPVAVCSSGFVLDRGADDWTEDAVATRSEIVASPEFQALIGRHSTHYMLGRTLEAEGADPAAVSWSYLSATWEVDQCRSPVADPRLEAEWGIPADALDGLYDRYVRDFLRVADRELAAMADDDERRIAYQVITANMHRRIGEFDQARTRLDALLAGYPEGMDEGWELPVRLLDQAIAARSTAQVAIEEPDGDAAP